MKWRLPSKRNRHLIPIADIDNSNCWYRQLIAGIDNSNCGHYLHLHTLTELCQPVSTHPGNNFHCRYQQFELLISAINCWYQQFELLISVMHCWYQQIIGDISKSNCRYRQLVLNDSHRDRHTHTHETTRTTSKEREQHCCLQVLSTSVNSSRPSSRQLLSEQIAILKYKNTDNQHPFW